MNAPAITEARAKALRERADDLGIVPRLDVLSALMEDALRSAGRVDQQLAPIWAEKLRHTYTKILEVTFPELAAANGDVLPISNVSPAMLEWEYFMIEQTGFADWIDDDGQVAPGSAVKARRFTGTMAPIGHKWHVTLFDLERAAEADLPLSNLYQRAAKRAHDAKTNWVWLFGDATKAMPGLVTHPNISKSMAALNAGVTSRLWANKSDAEIIADVVTLIDRIPQDTLEQEHAATVFLPARLIRLARARKLSGTNDSGMASLWDYIKNLYSGDDSGQGAVKFRALYEADATRRSNPVGGGDTSGIAGDFMIAIAGLPEEELAFIRARPYTQRPPQERDLVLHHMTHSKIGGCKCQKPLAVHRMDFGTT